MSPDPHATDPGAAGSPYARPEPGGSRRPARGAGRGRHAPALRLLLGLLLLLALLAAGHAVLWRWMANRMEAGFATWAETRRAQGWVVEHAAPVQGGWPFSATLTLPRFRLAGGGATVPGGIDWRAEALVLRLVPPRLERLTVEAQGPQRLRLGTLEVPFAADRLTAQVPLEAGVLPREAGIAADRLRLGTPAGAAELRRLRLELETRSTAIEGEPAVSATLSAEGLALPPGVAPPALGDRIASLAAEAALTGPIPAGRDPAERAAIWRDAGGTLELRSLQLRWGPAGGAASATLTLDERLQPMGAGTLRLTGFAEVLDALAAGGAIDARSAMATRAVAQLMARRPSEDAPPQIEVPVMLEHSTLGIARLRVARLPLWQWPGQWPGQQPAASP
ncbi:DUF2125 domain-containing protein [Roseomonas sp. NAR14]|uniref:DUF2125 domain-containing protein n=1 Tax=Roseomonas acroporae TaxID=2937791 RepID=A0A9X2BVZ3_9PROT|nr:DUF2125 domain-containing protein [Roseomonas acroporae]MCK8787168.1 DUF2125 domain-containing protein [Roseomonas acroporae]